MNRLFKLSFISLVYISLYIPMIVLIIYSFNKAQFSMLWHGLSLNWYFKLADDSQIWHSTINSILLGISSTTVACIIGMLTSYSLFYYRFWGKGLLHLTTFVLLLMPDLIIAIILLILFSKINLPLGFYSLLIAHVTLIIPFVIGLLYVRLSHLDHNIVYSATDLGANDYQIFSRIILPILGPTIITAWLLGFALSFDDVIISYFIAGPEFSVLPLKILSMAKIGNTGELNALASILFLATATVAGISLYVVGKNKNETNL